MTGFFTSTLLPSSQKRRARNIPPAPPLAVGNMAAYNPRMNHRIVLTIALLASAATAAAQDRAMPPESERQLARAIYKEMVEIKSGFTTGATTPVAEAVARRLKAAGFPAADIFVAAP